MNELLQSYSYAAAEPVFQIARPISTICSLCHSLTPTEKDYNEKQELKSARGEGKQASEPETFQSVSAVLCTCDND